MQSSLENDIQEQRNKIAELREWYRNNFINGNSDECFIAWIEWGLEELVYDADETEKD